MFQILKYLLLFPLSILYRLIIQIRYFLYGNGLNKIHKFETPIISVGNITIGGTGKTPMVHFIADELKTSYPKIAIISRGYGRKSKGFKLIHDGKNLKLNSEIAGDEPFLLANLLGNCIVAVDENRCNAIQKVEEEFSPDLIILDDGFQQLGIRKDVDIVLVNASKPFTELKLLPLGLGREHLDQLKRASLLVFTKTDNYTLPDWHEKLEFQQEIFTAKYESEIWQYTKGGYAKVDKVPENTFAFCGIADPNSFRMSLKTLGINPVKFKAFKDHEPYSTKKIEVLIKEIQRANIDHVITTEKDIVKLSDEFLEKHHIFTTRIKHSFTEKENFIEKIKSEIERNKK